MGDQSIKVPETVSKKALTLGTAGQLWLDHVEQLIPELEKKWQIKVSKVLSGGSEALVAEAVGKDNSKLILKIAMPDMAGNTVFENELSALRLVGGGNYVRVINFDKERRVLLLDRLGCTLRSLNLPITEQIGIICRTLKSTWIYPPEQAQLLTGNAIFTLFRDLIHDLYGSMSIPFSEKTINKALQFCDSRSLAFDPESAVLVHGDAHSGNLLQVNAISDQSQYFKFIDPDGIVCEPAYDLGVLMREWIDELLEDPVNLGRKRCAYLSRLTNVSPKAIWEWGFIQCVTTGLLLVKVDQEDEGKKLLRVAESWVDVVVE